MGCGVFWTKNITQSGVKKPLMSIQKSQRFRAEPCQHLLKNAAQDAAIHH